MPRFAQPGTVGAPWHCAEHCFQKYPGSWQFAEYQNCLDACHGEWPPRRFSGLPSPQPAPLPSPPLRQADPCPSDLYLTDHKTCWTPPPHPWFTHSSGERTPPCSPTIGGWSSGNTSPAPQFRPTTTVIAGDSFEGTNCWGKTPAPGCALQVCEAPACVPAIPSGVGFPAPLKYGCPPGYSLSGIDPRVCCPPDTFSKAPPASRPTTRSVMTRNYNPACGPCHPMDAFPRGPSRSMSPVPVPQGGGLVFDPPDPVPPGPQGVPLYGVPVPQGGGLVFDPPDPVPPVQGVPLYGVPVAPQGPQVTSIPGVPVLPPPKVPTPAPLPFAARAPNPRVTLAEISAENRQGPGRAYNPTSCVTTEEGIECCKASDGYWWCMKETCIPGMGCNIQVTWRPGADPEPSGSKAGCMKKCADTGRDLATCQKACANEPLAVAQPRPAVPAVPPRRAAIAAPQAPPPPSRVPPRPFGTFGSIRPGYPVPPQRDPVLARMAARRGMLPA